MTRATQGLHWLWLGALAWLAATGVPAGTRAQGLPGIPGLKSNASDAGAAPAPTAEGVETQLEANAATWQAKAAEFEALRSSVPERLEAVDAALEQAREAAPRTPSASLDTDQLDYELALAEQELARLQEEASALEAEPERRAKRRRELPPLIAAARTRLRALDEADTGPTAAAPGAEDAEGVRVHDSQRDALLAEIAAYEAELGSYDARVTLLARRRDLAALQVESQTQYVARLREALADAQRETVKADARRARVLLDELEGLPPKVQKAVRELAERNLAFSELWTGEDGLVEQIATVSERLTRARQQVTAVRSDLTRLTAKVDAAGLADSVGAMLRRERARAPDVGMYRRFVRMRADQITEAQLQQLRLAEQREAVADVESRVRETLLSMGDELSAEQRVRVEKLLRELFDNQRKYMDALVADHDEYFRKLTEFDKEQRSLIEESERLLAFINERVLWVRSGGPLGPELPGDLGASLTWLGDSRYLGQLGKAIQFGLRERSLTALLLGLAFVVVLATRRRLRARIRELAQGARSPSLEHFGPTGKALGLSLLGSVALPALAFAAMHVLEGSPAATQYTRAVAHGGAMAALLWGSLAIPYQLLAEDGLTQAHCQWPRVPCLRLRKHLLWLGGLAVLATFVMFTAEARGDEAMRESLARVTFMGLMVATAVFSHLVLRERGALSEILRMRQSRRVPQRTRIALHAALTLAPLLLGTGAALGFYWTALQLSVRLHMTLCLLLGILISSDLLYRWAAIAQRNVAAAREAEAREVEQRRSALPGGGGVDVETSRPSATSDILDLTAVSEQTRRLTASLLTIASVLGMVAIWADLLPAAGIFRKVELWRVHKEVDPGTSDAAASAAEALGEQWVPITLADLGVALVVGVVCIVLLRNLPGLLEVTLFRRLHAGERYAFATILKYAIAVTGVTLALESLGLSWSSLQWLVAAVGLGLGFGLQEIFANFVSGILILLERPIRVGDIVTVADISGTVTRIHIRATWITTFERKELVVPNKEFVTSKLINWSLSDPVLRVTVAVGIAYGSDVNRALAELHRVARENSKVLADPEPQVLFLGFGDSSLNLELRAFVGESGHALITKHELHLAIDAAFRDAGIEIPFPQRDIHVKGPAAPLTAPISTNSETISGPNGPLEPELDDPQTA